MRHHLVKPIDKVLPRKIIQQYGRDCVHVTSHPAFFRAPMLTSQIHAQWDAEFCKSTEYLMLRCSKDHNRKNGRGCENDDHGKDTMTSIEEQVSNNWDLLYLTKQEQQIVNHRKKTGVWLSISEFQKLITDEGKE